MLPDISRDTDDVIRLFQVITEGADGLLSGMDTDPDEIENGRVMGDRSVREGCGSKSFLIPSPRNGIPGGLSRIPSTYLNRIQDELNSGQYDIRIVLTECRDLEPGTREFSIRYFEARLKVLTVRSPLSRHLPLAKPLKTLAETAYTDDLKQSQEFATANSFWIRKPSDMFRHFGIWILAMLVLEVWNSWKLAEILDTYLLGGIWLLGGAVFSGFVMLNSILWFRYRNRHFSKFVVPGGVLVILVLILAAGLYFREAVMTVIENDTDWRPWFEKFRTAAQYVPTTQDAVEWRSIHFLSSLVDGFDLINCGSPGGAPSFRVGR